MVAGGRGGDDFPAAEALEDESGALLRLGGGGGEKWRHGLRWSPRSGMCESYSRSLLRVSVAQICQALGWDSVQLSACHLLTDVLQRYLQQLGRGCHRYSELCEYRAGYGRLSGRSRVTPPRSPVLSRRPGGVGPSLSPRDRVSSRPLTLLRSHCPWKLESSLCCLFACR